MVSRIVAHLENVQKNNVTTLQELFEKQEEKNMFINDLAQTNLASHWLSFGYSFCPEFITEADIGEIERSNLPNSEKLRYVFQRLLQSVKLVPLQKVIDSLKLYRKPSEHKAKYIPLLIVIVAIYMVKPNEVPVPCLKKHFGVPKLPQFTINMNETVSKIIEILDCKTESKSNVGLLGMIGSGKRTLANIVGRNNQVTECFPDGVIWITLGESSSTVRIIEIQNSLIKCFDNLSVTNIAEGQSVLRQILMGRKSLLIINDVWTEEQKEAFDVVDPSESKTRFLFTSSISKLLDNTQVVPMQLLTQEESLDALEQRIGRIRGTNREDEALEIIKETAGHFMSIVLAASMIKKKGFDTTLQLFRDASIESNELKGLEATARILPEHLKQKYFDLAVFKPDEPIPSYLFKLIWKGTQDSAIADQVFSLVEYNILQLIQVTDDFPVFRESSFFLLPIVRTHIVSSLRTKNLSEVDMHYRLIENVKAAYTTLESIEDKYLLNHIAYHLHKAERKEELKELLSSYSWIQLRINSGQLMNLIYDYSYVDEREFHWMMKSLIQSVHVLNKTPKELSSQLWGRLSRLKADYYPAITSLIKQIEDKSSGCWIKSHLSPPTSSLAQSFTNCYFADATPDRKKVFVLKLDKELTVWNHHTRQLQTLFTKQTKITALDVTKQNVIVGLLDGKVNVWNLATKQNIVEIQCSANRVHSVIATADETKLVCASFGEVSVWNLNTSKYLFFLNNSQVLCVTPDSRKLVSVYADQPNSLHVWDLQTGKHLQELKGHTKIISTAIATQNGKLISGSWDKTVRIWNLDTGKEEIPSPFIGESAIFSLAASSTVVVSGSLDYKIKIWDIETGNLLHSLSEHYYTVITLEITPDGTKAISGSGDGTIRIWEIETGELVCTLIGHSSAVKHLIVTNIGNELISYADDFTVRIWDLNMCKKDYGSTIVNLVATTSDKKYILSSAHSTVKLWDLETATFLRTLIRFSKTLDILSLSASNGKVVCQLSNGEVKVSNITGEKSIFTLASASNVIVLDSMLIFGSKEGTVDIWSLDKKQISFSQSGFITTEKSAIALSVDRESVIFVSNDRSIQMLSLSTKELHLTLCKIPENVSHIKAVQEIPNSKDFIFIYNNGIFICDRRTGSVHFLFQDTNCISTSVVARNSKTSLLCLEQGTIKIWDLKTNSLQKLIPATTYAITTDGMNLVTASEKVSVWSLSSNLKLLCEFTPDTDITTLSALDDHSVVAGNYVGKVSVISINC